MLINNLVDYEDRWKKNDKKYDAAILTTLNIVPASLKFLRKVTSKWDKTLDEKKFISKCIKDDTFLKNTIQSIENKISRGIFISILAGFLSYGGMHIYEKITDQSHLTASQKFWDHNESFFTPGWVFVDEDLSNNVHIRRDAWGALYQVQAWDTREKIIKKLSIHKEFSYLDNDEYKQHKSKSFNIPDASLKVGMWIPIPLDADIRKIAISDFMQYSKEGLEELKEDPHYGETVKELCKKMKEEDIVAAMIAFARSEASWDYTNFSDDIWSAEFHRREPKYNTFSLSPYHILMAKWPGLTAKEKLQLSDIQCYHPKNAAKLFLAYCIERTQNNPIKLLQINDNTIHTIAKLYNGKWYKINNYDKKLWRNFEYAKKINNWEIKLYNNTLLEAYNIRHKGINSKWKNIYTYQIPIEKNEEKDQEKEKKLPKKTYTTQAIQKEIKEKINQTSPTNPIEINDIHIVDKKWKQMDPEQVYTAENIIYFLIP